MFHEMDVLFREEHTGVGGLYFICCSIICAFVLFVTVRLSWNSQAISVADNIAYITAINISVNSYLDGVSSNAGTPVYAQSGAGYLYWLEPGFHGKTHTHRYDPLADFNQMANDMGIANGRACQQYYCYWTTMGSDNPHAAIQYGDFITAMGTSIRPHEQESIIERD